MLKVYLEKYFFALRSKVPNNYKIITLFFLGVSLSLTVLEGVSEPARCVFGIISLLIILFLGIIAP